MYEFSWIPFVVGRDSATSTLTHVRQRNWLPYHLNSERERIQFPAICIHDEISKFEEQESNHYYQTDANLIVDAQTALNGWMVGHFYYKKKNLLYTTTLFNLH